MSRAPKKYLDADRTRVSDEWREWHRKREADMEHAQAYALGPGGIDVYFPEEIGKDIPDEGRWIRILEEPSTVLRLRFRLPIMSIWYARPYTMNAGRVRGRAPQLAQITTPGGDLCLYPHEYEVWDDPSVLLGMEPDVVIHKMDGDLALDTDDEDRLFYLMKAGITRHDALMLMLTQGVDPRWWFEFTPEIVEEYGGVGRPLWRHIQMNPRKKAVTA